MKQGYPDSKNDSTHPVLFYKGSTAEPGTLVKKRQDKCIQNSLNIVEFCQHL